MRPVLLRPRWLAGHAIALVVMIAFVALGFWQLARDHHKQQLVRDARAAYAAPAPDLGTTPPPGGARAQASGAFDTAHEVVLRNQVRGGSDGVDILMPLRLADGTAVLVDRGWLASAGSEPAAPAVPAGPVLVRGIAHPSSVLSPRDDVTTVGGRLALPRVDLARIGRDLPYRLQTVWLEARSQQPPPAAGAPTLPQPPPPDQVNHLQYAIQWFGFAAIPLVGWPILLWRITRRRRVSP